MLEKKDVKIGDRIRFINDESLYEDAPFIIKPILGKVYTVRAYSFKGFYLKEIINELVNWIDPVSNNIDSIDEPGFGAWRFEKLKTHPIIGYQIEKDLEPYFEKEKKPMPTLEPMTKQRGSKSKEFFL